MGPVDVLEVQRERIRIWWPQRNYDTFGGRMARRTIRHALHLARAEKQRRQAEMEVPPDMIVLPRDEVLKLYDHLCRGGDLIVMLRDRVNAYAAGEERLDRCLRAAAHLYQVIQDADPALVDDDIRAAALGFRAIIEENVP